MANVSDITTAIMNGNWATEDLQRMANAINMKNRERQARATAVFGRGDKVEFTTKRGETVKGTVTRVNQKTVSVQSFEGVQWKVSGSLLRKRA